MKLTCFLLPAVVLFSLQTQRVVASDIPPELIYSSSNIKTHKVKAVVDEPNKNFRDYRVAYKKQLSEDVAVVPVVMTGRYSAVMPKPTASQKNPLKILVTIHFPAQIVSVGQAIHYLLKRSGYRLANAQVSDPSQNILLNLPLPAVHRELGPMPLYRALSTLSGEAYLLVIDPVHRLVGFDLKESFEYIVQH